jgi:hypothetical protein
MLPFDHSDLQEEMVVIVGKKAPLEESDDEHAS